MEVKNDPMNESTSRGVVLDTMEEGPDRLFVPYCPSSDTLVHRVSSIY
jgi:hypothetical protein